MKIQHLYSGKEGKTYDLNVSNTFFKRLIRIVVHFY